MPKIDDALRLIDTIYPFSLAEDWDNVGLLAGNPEDELTGIVCDLDLSDETLDRASAARANLILTHHPILFRGRKNLREDCAEGRLLCRLIRGRFALIAAHTNFDNAGDGMNQALSEELGLFGIEPLSNGLHIGYVPEMTGSAFAELAGRRLGTVVRAYGDGDKAVRRVCVCGGAGGEFANIALAAGADVFLTGEMRYHDALDFSREGLLSLICGHDGTERVAVKTFVRRLQNEANALKWNVNVL